MERSSIIFLTLAAFSAAGGQLMFKVGALGREQAVDFINLPIFSGLVLYAVGTAIWIYALSYEKLVKVYSFTALTFVLVYLGGVLILGEKISLINFCGMSLILGGLYLVTR